MLLKGDSLPFLIYSVFFYFQHHYHHHYFFFVLENTASSVYPQVLNPEIQPIVYQKYLLGKGAGGNFRKFQKVKLNLLHAGNYLHSIHIVLGIIG